MAMLHHQAAIGQRKRHPAARRLHALCRFGEHFLSVRGAPQITFQKNNGGVIKPLVIEIARF